MTDRPPVEPRERFCHNCGASNPADFNFCPRCGTRINFLRPLPAAASAYPVRFDVEYPEKLSRLSALARLILAIPQLLIIYALGTVVGIITFIAWFAILFTRRYPKGLFELVVGFNRWIANVYAYTALLRDEYPPFSTDPGRYAVTYDVDYPEKLSRWLIFVKWFLALLHQIALYILGFVALVAEIIAWFAIIITGRFPRGLFNYVVGVMRWYLRVSAYTSLMSDKFPPYSRRADARPGTGRAVVVSALLAIPAAAGFGVVMILIFVGIFAAAGALTSSTEEVTVRYSDIRAGNPTFPVDISGTQVTLLRAEDPFLFRGAFGDPAAGHRFVRFELEVTNIDALFTSATRGTFRLKDSRGREHKPVLAQGVSLEAIEQGRTVAVGVIFELRNVAQPSELTYSPGIRAFFPIGERVRFKFIESAVSVRSTVPAEFGEEVIVVYEDLLEDRPSRPVDIDGMEVVLRGARDLDQTTGNRSVRFNLEVTNVGAPPGPFSAGDFSLSDSRSVNYDPDLVSVSESGQTDEFLEEGETAQISVVFQPEPNAELAELSYTPDPATVLSTGDIVRFVFR